MRFFGWFRRAPQEEVTEASTPHRWAWIGGRRTLTNTPYIMPKDKIEGDRLDLQHHLYKLLLGANFRAPVRQPRAILDVACGTGIWGREMALQFKRTQVIGFDIDRTPMEAALARLGPTGQFPPNFRFLEADALKPFPFEDESFDFTHARAISPFVPSARWPDLIREMVRVTKLGGYIELVDFVLPSSPSPALTLLMGASRRLAAERGIQLGAAPYLADYLRQAGLKRVQERHGVIGTGNQRDRQQRLMATDALAILTSMQPIVVRAGLLSEAEYTTALEQARLEVPKMGVSSSVTCAFSIKL